VVSRKVSGGYANLSVGGMFEDCVTFDTSSPRIFETYFSYILGNINSSTSVGVDSSTNNINTTKIKSKKSSTNKTKNKSPVSTGSSFLDSQRLSASLIGSNSVPPSGVRSFSTVNKINPYSIEFSRNGNYFCFSFSSSDELKSFFKQELYFLITNS